MQIVMPVCICTDVKHTDSKNIRFQKFASVFYEVVFPLGDGTISSTDVFFFDDGESLVAVPLHKEKLLCVGDKEY